MRYSIIFLVICALLGGCASSEIQQRESYAAEARLPRPGRVIVYDIKATEADVPATSALTGYYGRTTMALTPEELALGRQLGQQVSNRLVRNILDMGMAAQHAGNGPPPQIGDVVLTGQFITIDEGDRTKRVTIGFGKGSAELKTHIEGYLVTSEGLRLLGRRQVGAEGGKKPGMLAPTAGSILTRSPVGFVVGSAVNIRKESGSETIEGAAKRTADEIAKELEMVFRKQGWI